MAIMQYMLMIIFEMGMLEEITIIILMEHLNILFGILAKVNGFCKIALWPFKTVLLSFLFIQIHKNTYEFDTYKAQVTNI